VKPDTTDLNLRIFDRQVRLRCDDELCRRLALANYAAFLQPGDAVDVDYSVTRYPSGGFSICRDGESVAEISSDEAPEYMLVYLLEKLIAIDLQKLRTDLYFVHSSALSRNGRVVMIAAVSGTGKSTVTWALLQHGFDYLSDELAPIDPLTLLVHPYPHALCLKTRPPGPYPLPEALLRTEKTLHIPVDSLPAAVISQPVPLRALIFLQRDRTRPVTVPSYTRVSPAEAGARLYANTLNALAHPGSGLDAAIRIAGAVPAFNVQAGDLQATCELISNLEETL
jgi:hypothetical protein